MHILVVDDDEALLKLITAKLRSLGHTVDPRSTGLGVVAILGGWDGSERPDLCILDNWLPELNGIALLTLLAKTVKAKDIPVILYSADSNIQDEVSCTKHGYVKYILKESTSELFDEVAYFSEHGSFKP